MSIGISDYAQERLGDIVFVELPELGREVASGEECCVVESVKAASDVFSPIRGTVVAVNEVLTDEPGQLNSDAYGTWIFCVKPDNAAEMDKLLDAASYQALMEASE